MKITKIFGMAIGAMILGAVPAMAQNSFPAPGSGGGYNPAPPQNSLPAPGAGGGFRPAPGGPGMMAPPPAGNPGWGGYGPSVGLNISFGSPVAQDQGYETVMACGYDAHRKLSLLINPKPSAITSKIPLAVIPLSSSVGYPSCFSLSACCGCGFSRRYSRFSVPSFFSLDGRSPIPFSTGFGSTSFPSALSFSST